MAVVFASLSPPWTRCCCSQWRRWAAGPPAVTYGSCGIRRILGDGGIGRVSHDSRICSVLKVKLKSYKLPIARDYYYYYYYYQCTDLSDTVMHKKLQGHCTVNYKTTRNADKQWLDQSLKDDWNSTVFRLRRNDISDDAFLTEGGRLFHARAFVYLCVYVLLRRNKWITIKHVLHEKSFKFSLCGRKSQDPYTLLVPGSNFVPQEQDPLLLTCICLAPPLYGFAYKALTCADDASASSSHRMRSLPDMKETGFTRRRRCARRVIIAIIMTWRHVVSAADAAKWLITLARLLAVHQ